MSEDAETLVGFSPTCGCMACRIMRAVKGDGTGGQVGEIFEALGVAYRRFSAPLPAEARMVGAMAFLRGQMLEQRASAETELAVAAAAELRPTTH